MKKSSNSIQLYVCTYFLSNSRIKVMHPGTSQSLKYSNTHTLIKQPFLTYYYPFLWVKIYIINFFFLPSYTNNCMAPRKNSRIKISSKFYNFYKLISNSFKCVVNAMGCNGPFYVQVMCVKNFRITRKVFSLETDWHKN